MIRPIISKQDKAVSRLGFLHRTATPCGGENAGFCEVLIGVRGVAGWRRMCLKLGNARIIGSQMRVLRGTVGELSCLAGGAEWGICLK